MITVTALVVPAAAAAPVSPAATSERVLFASANGQLTAFRYSTEQVLPAGTGTHMVSLAPDGRLLASAGSGVGSDVRYLRPGGAATILVNEVEWGFTTPSWAAGSNEFSYQAKKTGSEGTGTSLHIADVIENRTITVTDIEPVSDKHWGHIGSSFAPSGRRLASVDDWTTDTGPSYHLSIYDLASGSRQTLVETSSSPGFMSQPSWSPSGGSIAYIQGSSIRTINPATGAVTVLYEEQASQVISAPQWSPDGTRLAYTYTTTGAPFSTGLAIAVVDLNGNRSVVVPNASLRTRSFVWTGTDTIAFADDRTVSQVALGGQMRTLFQASASVDSLTYGPDTDQGWLPLVAAARPIDAACPRGSVTSAGFVDVGPTSTHGRAIDCVAWWNVAQGTSTSTYAPAASVTRGQMATFIARTITRSGGTLPADPPDAFGDVDGGTHALAVNQLAAVGVVGGTGNGNYSPNRPVTRAQMATFIANAYKYRVNAELPPARGDYFLDDQGNTHEKRINQVAEAGLAGGTGENQYSPAGDVRRDQMASFIARLLDLLVEDVNAALPAA